jgi:LCP family protein required for cell wall assembly
LAVSGTTIDDDRPPHVARGVLWRLVLGGVIIVLATAGAVAAGVLLQVKDVVDTLHKYGHVAKIKPGTIEVAKPGKPQTLLLVGSDHRYGTDRQDARSDTMMLVRLDPDQKATAVLSIPRDLQVEIPGRGLAKINEAYSLGGLDLVARTIKSLLSQPGQPFKINHVVGVNFVGFRDAVNQIGCVYTDVDRRYYHSNAGLPPSEQYSEINIQPGYQKLCGDKALAYVRFRHLDNDLVRAARQQAFLRDAKDQLATQNLLSQMKPLVKIFAKATETDASLQSSQSLLSLARLAIYSSGHPVRQIQFPATFVNQAEGLTSGTATGMGDYVTATSDQLADIVHEFMHAAPAEEKPSSASDGDASSSSSGKRSGSSKAHSSSSKHDKDYGPEHYSLVDAQTTGEDLVANAMTKHHGNLPVLIPRWLTPNGRYAANVPPNAPSPRIYTIADRDGHKHTAYRMVISENPVLGQYYGVQGTTWADPPILDGSYDKRRMGGRTFQLYWDGKKLRVVALKTKHGTYWVSNTLTGSLSNNQMLGIARSLTRFGRSI